MNVVNLQEFTRRKSFKECVNQIGKIYEEAGLVGEEYRELISQDIDKAIKRLPEFIENARNAGMPGGRSYESLAGGPNPDFIMPLINGIGRIYPELSKETRNLFAKNVLNYLDGLRCDYSQSHVEDIEEPWLVRDILLDRSLYFPGYKNYADFLKKFRTWEEFNQGLGSKEGQIVRSPFWLTLALIHPKYSSLGIRKNYYDQFGPLVDRTLDALAALDYEWGKKHVERNNLNFEKRLKERANIGPLFEGSIKQTKGDGLLDFEEELEDRIKNIDPLLHERLRKKFGERNWRAIH